MSRSSSTPSHPIDIPSPRNMSRNSPYGVSSPRFFKTESYSPTQQRLSSPCPSLGLRSPDRGNSSLLSSPTYKGLQFEKIEQERCRNCNFVFSKQFTSPDAVFCTKDCRASYLVSRRDRIQQEGFQRFPSKKVFNFESNDEDI